MTALSRSGIQFSDAQKEVVKQLVATGDVVGAQKIILKELETQFGGSAEAARNTLGGALKGLKNAFGDLFEGDSKGGGVKGTTAALNELTELLSDKQTVENAQILTNAMITGFGKVLTAISKTVEFTKWLGEELAAQVYGVAGDDIIRLTAKLEKAKDKLNELEAPYAKLSVFDKLLGKIGISKATLDYLRGIKSAREEVAKLQKQVDDFYAFEEAQKKKGAPAIPSVPSVSAEGTEGKLKTDKDSMDKLKKMMEEGKTLTASLRTEQEKYNDTLARLKILLDAGAISQDTYNRAIEKAGESLAEKQAQFQDDYKRATLSATEYELQQLQDLYVEREAYVEDKLKLDEWYWAEKKKILDKETDDASDAFNAMSEFGVQAAHNMQDAFSGFLYDVFDGQLKKAKDYFEEFAKTILRMSTNMMAQMAAQKMFGSMGQGGGDWGWVGSLASGAMGAWGGGKAEGGLVQPNTAYLVGEHGPELLQMGNQGGSIISNEGIQQTPQVNIRNINVLDPSIVGDYLSTHEGEQVIMNVVQRNQ
jgi:hypothetical protein